MRYNSSINSAAKLVVTTFIADSKGPVAIYPLSVNKEGFSPQVEALE